MWEIDDKKTGEPDLDVFLVELTGISRLKISKERFCRCFKII